MRTPDVEEGEPRDDAEPRFAAVSKALEMDMSLNESRRLSIPFNS
jgi:hypothetical protein